VRILLASIIGSYLLIVLVMLLAQRRFIYLPMKLSTAEASEIARAKGFVPWRGEGDAVIGWRMPATATPTASVLVAHGNAGSAVHRGYFAEPIHALGNVEVFVLEYPGYGVRDGSPSLQSLLAAAESAFLALPPKRPVYIVTESLGAGVGAHLARTFGPSVSGLLFFAPYDDLASVGQAQMPFLPVRLLMRDRFKPAEWLKDFSGPLKVVLAESDSIIPMPIGKSLYDSYRGPKSLEIVPNADHNDIAGKSPDWWKAVFAFWESGGAKKPGS
jgi:pimeloyl-ACP methyl ester carboxylesterase